ncbi:MAG: peptide deformylase [Desulfobacterota bacterium]|nr:peptide deformylase [Thermodesulfobacteriota bacterium]MDW8002253.1 peptide deformylase [Deltaproteobacteria bacterium]
MAVLEIRRYPDPILKRKATLVTDISSEIVQLAKDMVETMRSQRGIGLAANQVGYLLRVIVVDGLSTEEPIVMVNPEILAFEDEEVREEGCLSIPGYFEYLKRAKKVWVRGIDLQGQQLDIECEGLVARVFQHEIDHLDGILFVDRLSPVKRSLFKKNYEGKKG